MSITFDDDVFRLLSEQAAKVGLEHRMGQYIGQLVRAVDSGNFPDPKLLDRVEALQQDIDRIRAELGGPRRTKE